VLVTPLAGMAFLFGLRSFNWGRTALFFEYVFLSLFGSFALMVLSYLCMASAGTRVDAELLAADRTLGFDWIAIYRALGDHPFLMTMLKLLYQSLLIQGFYVTVLLGLRGERGQMRELWRLTTIACVLCCLTAMLFPALGPFNIFGLESQGIFLPDMKHLLSKHHLVFDAGSLTGVICFPSFHTVLALACPYALRRTGPIFWIFAVLDLLMLFSIPFIGGHYLTDMIAGAVVMLAALGIVKLMEKNTFAWPRSAALLPHNQSARTSLGQNSLQGPTVHI
jgi:PAP2 superfamily